MTTKSTKNLIAAKVCGEHKKNSLRSLHSFAGILFFSIFFVVHFFLISFPVNAQEASATEASTPVSSSPWNFNFGKQPRPEDARTVIDAQDGAWFDDTSNRVEFFGKVVVHDPQFTLTCDRLNIVMNKNRQGLQMVTATGDVNIEQQGANDAGEKIKSVGKAGVAIYEPATGDITLKALPHSPPDQWPQVRQGKNFQIATEEGTIMILNSKGTFHAKGQTRTIILDAGEKGKSQD